MKTFFTPKIFIVLGLVVVGLAYHLISSSNPSSEKPIVAITQIIAHPALDDVRAGIMQGLADKGYTDKESIDIIFKGADGDPSLTVPIGQEFVRQNASVIVPITTPSALGVVKASTSTPIVFSGVTDPVAVGLVDDLNRPGGRITGTSDRWPFKAQVEAFLDLFPKTKSIGMIYTNGDDVSQYGVNALKKISNELGFELNLSPISSSQDVYPAAINMFQHSDAVFIGIDALVLENLNSLLKAADETGKPLFAGDSGSVERGAVMALSINMKELGILTGHIVAQVLNGKDPAEIPISVVKSGSLHLNGKKAKIFGLDTSTLSKQGYEIIN